MTARRVLDRLEMFKGPAVFRFKISNLLLLRFLWPLAVVQVGFAQPSFTASESLGSVSVCINIFGATLASSVTVLLSTQDDTAIGEFIFVFNY